MTIITNYMRASDNKVCLSMSYESEFPAVAGQVAGDRVFAIAEDGEVVSGVILSRLVAYFGTPGTARDAQAKIIITLMYRGDEL